MSKIYQYCNQVKVLRFDLREKDRRNCKKEFTLGTAINSTLEKSYLTLTTPEHKQGSTAKASFSSAQAPRHPQHSRQSSSQPALRPFTKGTTKTPLSTSPSEKGRLFSKELGDEASRARDYHQPADSSESTDGNDPVLVNPDLQI